MGQTRDAIEAYVSASQRALARGDQGESEKLADKALKLEPSNLAAVIVKARSYSSRGISPRPRSFWNEPPISRKAASRPNSSSIFISRIPTGTRLRRSRTACLRRPEEFWADAKSRRIPAAIREWPKSHGNPGKVAAAHDRCRGARGRRQITQRAGCQHAWHYRAARVARGTLRPHQ